MKPIFLIWPTDISKQSALYPPLGLASLASVLKKKNYQVKMVDLSFDEKWEQVRCLKEEDGIYGISFTSSLYSNAKKCVRIIRENDRNSKIVLGGPHPSVLPAETLEDIDADVVCIGEAETSFPSVVEALQNGADLRSIRGIAYRDDKGKIMVNPEREKIKDLDCLPFPDQSVFPYEKHFKQKGFRELSIITSRGCPGQCTFCQPTIQKMFGKKIRFSGSGYVVDQIRYLKEKYKLDFFVISDDTFITNRKRVLELCEKIVSGKIHIFWRCQTRISLLDRQIIRAMKRAGCFVIALGVESGSQDILDGLQKKILVDQIKEVFRVCHQEGMLTHAYLMIGSPGESRKTVEETKNLLREIKPFTSNVCVTTPYPGTYLYETLKKENLLEYNLWDHYDHLMSDAVHIRIPHLNLHQLNEFKDELLEAQKYPLFKLKCLWKAFINGNNLRRLGKVVSSNPGILYRGFRLFLRSVFLQGLELSNPRTKAYRIYSPKNKRIKRKGKKKHSVL
ncbi:MAG: B12-binding domain-containing radical SAM protein [Candidatus Aminicenantes bacterium]